MFRLLLLSSLLFSPVLGAYDWKGEVRAHARKLLDGARASLRLLPEPRDPALAKADRLIGEALEALGTE